MKEKKANTNNVNEHSNSNQKEKSIDQLINEIAQTKDWSTLVPDYDEDALMVHWSSKS